MQMPGGKEKWWKDRESVAKHLGSWSNNILSYILHAGLNLFHLDIFAIEKFLKLM